MHYFMARTFDHSGYYETRLILMVVGLAVAAYSLMARRDYRYLLMFGVGVVLQAALEYTLWLLRLRGDHYSLLVFGTGLSPELSALYQGLVEGGILCLMGFWLADLLLDRLRDRAWCLAYALVCVLIVGLAVLVGILAVAVQSVTSYFSIVADTVAS